MLVFSFLSHIKYKSYKKLYIFYKYYANKLLETTKFSKQTFIWKVAF